MLDNWRVCGKAGEQSFAEATDCKAGLRYFLR